DHRRHHPRGGAPADVPGCEQGRIADAPALHPVHPRPRRMERAVTPPTALIVRTLVRMGQLSPCAKSKRGVVIADERMTTIVANAFNGPPPPFTCGGDDACRAACNKICVHAEAA